MDDRGNLVILEGGEEEQRAEALKRGLVRIPDDEAQVVAAMELDQRKAWMARRLATHGDGELEREAKRRLRNKLKAERRKRRR